MTRKRKATFVEAVLVVLSLLTAAGHRVEFVHEAAAAAAAGAGRLAALVLLVGGRIVVARDLIDEVHNGGKPRVWQGDLRIVKLGRKGMRNRVPR